MTEKSKRRNIPAETPKSINAKYHRNDKFFRWSFSECIWEHKGWQEIESIQSFVNRIISKLQQFETMKWQEILNSSGGKAKGKGNNNHFIDATKLPEKEKKNFIKLGYMEDFVGNVFSLRLSGKERLIGIVDLDVFKILWFDAEHEFF